MQQRDKKKLVYVTIYEIDRLYGGPEEDGWWYDWLTPVLSRKCRPEIAEQVQNQLYKAAKKMYGVCRYSKRLKNVTIYIDGKNKGEFETKKRPYYE